jgi:hypothetical protein
LAFNPGDDMVNGVIVFCGILLGGGVGVRAVALATGIGMNIGCLTIL